MISIKINKNDIILWFLTIWLLVDSINGLVIRLGLSLPLSVLFKFLILCFIIIWNKKNKNIVRIFIFFLFYIILYSSVISLGDYSVGYCLNYIIKFITVLILFYYFKILLQNQYVNYIPEIKRIMFFSLLILSANILMGLGGLGYSTYREDGTGFCGLFYSPNELSGVIAVLYPLSLAYVKLCHKKFFLLFSIFLLFISLLIGTKAPLITAIISVLMVSFLYGSRREKGMLIILVGIVIISGVSYIGFLLESEISIVERFTFFMEKDGLLGALTSGRLDMWEEAEPIFDRAPFLRKLIGMGYSQQVEMDPYDMLLFTGYSGLFVLLLLYCILIINPLTKKNNIFSKAVFTSNILLVFLSISSGHIAFSSMAGMYIALSNALLYSNKLNVRNGAISCSEVC